MQSQETSASTIAQEKQIIQDVLGGIGLDAISLNDSGWDSRVYEVKPYNYFFKYTKPQFTEHFRFRIWACV
jgi:hypothetical protein